ncbi:MULTISPECIES: helix-turn-helix domain-containing protein [Amycolatopsis]|uniref:AraC-like ligand-binding domain-containing protein n=1 Tax=Amycolatopsis TaxID=1813 RepID=UPI0031F88D21
MDGATLPTGSGTSQDGVRHASGFDEWKRMLGHRFVPVRLVSEHGAAFTGTLRERVLRDVSVSEITADSHRVIRASSQISPDDPALLKLSVQLGGGGLIVQDGRQAVLSPGDVAVYDTARPYTLAFDDTIRCLVFAFPRSAIGLGTGSLREVTAVRIDGSGPSGRLVVPFLRTLADTVLDLPQAQALRFAHNALDLVTTLLTDVLEGRPHRGRRDRVPTLEDVLDWIEANLSDPGLSLGRIAQAHYVSPRYLQNLFSHRGDTVTGWIRSRRLERCRRELADPLRAGEPVGAVGRRWGFGDPAHFSRAFKARYGVPPARYRDLSA